MTDWKEALWLICEVRGDLGDTGDREEWGDVIVACG